MESNLMCKAFFWDRNCQKWALYSKMTCQSQKWHLLLCSYTLHVTKMLSLEFGNLTFFNSCTVYSIITFLFFVNHLHWAKIWITSSCQRFFSFTCFSFPGPAIINVGKILVLWDNTCHILTQKHKPGVSPCFFYNDECDRPSH